MSKSKHRQHGGAQQWNPPPIPKGVRTPLAHSQNVASANECTGLEAQPVISKGAAEDYTALYSLHEQKTQGNIGKGNPRNDPSEILFHRT